MVVRARLDSPLLNGGLKLLCKHKTKKHSFNRKVVPTKYYYATRLVAPTTASISSAARFALSNTFGKQVTSAQELPTHVLPSRPIKLRCASGIISISVVTIGKTVVVIYHYPKWTDAERKFKARKSYRCTNSNHSDLMALTEQTHGLH